MQDFQPFPGHIFGSGRPGAELRRLVAYPAATTNQQQQQPVKCPRCDSPNTKFCYYNNYNLSQPRHFCKSCRRYWTKGGVLRNVPVGGGCRKPKRSSSSTTSESPSKSSDKDPQRRRACAPSSASGCSSDSLTAAAAASSSTSFPDSTLLSSHLPVSNPNPPLEPSVLSDPTLCPAPTIYPDPSAMIGFRFSDPPPTQSNTAEQMRAGFADQTVPVDPRPGESGSVLPALDWSGPEDPHFFDLSIAVDHAAYWNQSHWIDADPNLYLP